MSNSIEHVQDAESKARKLIEDAETRKSEKIAKANEKARQIVEDAEATIKPVKEESIKKEQTFIIEGWVQKRLVGELEERLSNVTGGRMHVDKIDGDELAPTHTRRPKILQPFDYLVSFYSVQRSDEIDPTWIRES